jgi:hypothetical protein
MVVEREEMVVEAAHLVTLVLQCVVLVWLLRREAAIQLGSNRPLPEQGILVVRAFFF